MFSSSLYSFVQFVNMVAVDLVGERVCSKEARKVEEVVVYFRVNDNDSIARCQYRAVNSVRGYGDSLR